MTKTLRVVQAMRRLQTGLLWLSIGTVLLACIGGLVISPYPWRSVLVAVVLALAMYGVTMLTVRAATRSEDLNILPVVLDYLAKIVLVALGLIAAKNLEFLDVQLVAAVAAFAVLGGMLVQVWAFRTLNRSDHHS